MANRKYTREFKISAVGLVNAQGYTIPEAAKSLGIDPSNLRGWITRFSSETGTAPSGQGAVAAELARLRKENGKNKQGQPPIFSRSSWEKQTGTAANFQPFFLGRRPSCCTNAALLKLYLTRNNP